MKSLLTPSLLIILIVTLFTQSGKAQPGKDPCNHTASLLAMLQRFHYSPVVFTDSVIEDIYSDFYKNLDPENVYFLNEDIVAFSGIRPKLSGINSNDQVCTFLEKVSRTYKMRLENSLTTATNILQDTFVYSSTDSLIFTHKYIAHFSENEEVLRSRWVRKLKFSVLEKLFLLNDTLSPTQMSHKIFAEKESELRSKILKQQNRSFQRIIQYPGGINSFVAEVFLNSIANRFDPHTIYFSPSGKNDFINTLSVEAKSFGLSVSENNIGEIVVQQIIPGSPAWESGLINNGDILLQVKKPEGELIDFTFASEAEAYEILNTSVYDQLTFIFRKANGLKSEVELEKAEIKVEQNTTSGFILQGEKKIGYIALPDFYTGNNDKKPQGLANDVTKELLKMQKEDIDGLILDLRFNGGGAINEAIGLAGIFINEGPLFTYKLKGEKPQVVKDLNRGTIYNGPLVIIVNSFSASASELVASILQYYNRAVIAGTQTFGKATGQFTLPLDTNFNMFRPPTEFNQDAFLNITMEKLYNLDGTSYQKSGLKPDIELPDLYKPMKINESSYPYALEPDESGKKVFYLPLPVLPITELAHNSSQRMLSSPVFSEIQRISDSISNSKAEMRVIKLTPGLFGESYYLKSGFIKKLEKMIDQESDSVPFTINGSNFNKRMVRNNAYKKEKIESATTQMNKDVFIKEAFMIISDLIKMQNN